MSQEGVSLRDWNWNQDLMKCSTCSVILHRKHWVFRESGKKTCPCCGLQLKRNSRGKKARQERQNKFLQKQENK